MSNAAEKASFEYLPPQLSGKQKVVALSATTSAARTNIFAHLTAGTAPAEIGSSGNWVQVTVKCNGGEAFVAFKLGSAAATVTASTGYPLNDGDEAKWWINAKTIDDIEYITASSTATLHLYLSSPYY